MVGDFVRDKDAVTATLLACEIAAIQKEKGSNIYAYLQNIYSEVGYYKEHLISVVKKGKKGAEEISEILKNMRSNPYLEIAGSKVVRIEDYSKDEALNIEEGVSEKLNIPLSNVLIYITKDGSKIAARPSGTEPKIKFYISVNAEKEEMLQGKIDSIISHLNMG
jgi:phosphomannomutase